MDGYRRLPAGEWGVEGIWGSLVYEMVKKGFVGWGGCPCDELYLYDRRATKGRREGICTKVWCARPWYALWSIS